MLKRNTTVTLFFAVSLAIAGCAGERDEPASGEVLPDTFPMTGTASDLPGGAQLPPRRDTAPR